MIKYILILFVFITNTSLSQYSNEPSDIEILDKKKNKLKFIFNLDARNSFVIGDKIKFWGIKIGFGNKKNRFGLGFYGNREPVVRLNNKLDSLDATDTTNFNYEYSSIYYERVLYNSKRWDISCPLHLNIGSLKGFYKDTIGKSKLFFEEKVPSITFSIKSHFKIWRWFGLGVGFGYNSVITKNKRIKKGLSAPFYSYGVKVFLGEAWKLLVNRNEYRKTEWIE